MLWTIPAHGRPVKIFWKANLSIQKQCHITISISICFWSWMEVGCLKSNKIREWLFPWERKPGEHFCFKYDRIGMANSKGESESLPPRTSLVSSWPRPEHDCQNSPSSMISLWPRSKFFHALFFDRPQYAMLLSRKKRWRGFRFPRDSGMRIRNGT